MAKQPMPKDTVLQVQQRSRGRCERCLLPAPKGVLHHRQPRGMGGSTDVPHAPANVMLLHDSCHRWLHAHPQRAYQEGLLVKHGTDPATVPVLTSQGLMFLSGQNLPD